jgi:hypothetical protein
VTPPPPPPPPPGRSHVAEAHVIYADAPTRRGGNTPGNVTDRDALMPLYVSGRLGRKFGSKYV